MVVECDYHFRLRDSPAQFEGAGGRQIEGVVHEKDLVKTALHPAGQVGNHR